MYTQVNIYTTSENLKEIFIALLGESGYEGFEETSEGVIAFIQKENFDEGFIKALAGEFAVSFGVSEVEKQNWNAQWEQNFQPVIVDDFCLIRAGFHKPADDIPHEIVITPKMSFGTGHHATTFLMVRQMRDLDFAGKKVLDFGTGTGILAIMAEKLGANEVIAIDNDKWACNNAKENIETNGCKRTKVLQGTLEDAPQMKYDIILANINRHILLHYMAELPALIGEKGQILMSGILHDDRPLIVASAKENGLELVHEYEKDNWLLLQFNAPKD